MTKTLKILHDGKDDDHEDGDWDSDDDVKDDCIDVDTGDCTKNLSWSCMNSIVLNFSFSSIGKQGKM